MMTVVEEILVVQQILVASVKLSKVYTIVVVIVIWACLQLYDDEVATVLVDHMTLVVVHC